MRRNNANWMVASFLGPSQPVIRPGPIVALPLAPIAGRIAGATRASVSDRAGSVCNSQAGRSESSMASPVLGSI